MTLMKIHLINPPSPGDYPFTREGRCMQKEGVWTTVWPPISLATMGAVLRDQGFEVKINDCPSEGIREEKLKELLAELQPDLLIINTATPSIKYDMTIPRLAKAAVPGIKTAAFGIHVGILPKESFELAGGELDFIISGEPEFTALELAQKLRGGEEIENIVGLSLRRNGVVASNFHRPFYRQLDELPFPAWDLIDLNRYTLPFNGRKFVMLMTSRGCPYDCTFCVAQSYYGKKIRKRSAKRIVDEIEWNIETNEVRDFFFWSESFTIIKKNIHELCDEILRRGLTIKWVCNSRADSVDFDLLRKMKSAGCWMISYGIESGDQGILDASLKRITIEQIRNAVKLARQVGMEIAGHFVLGLPGENEETMSKTASFSRELDLDYAQFYCAAPWPGSRLFDIAKSERWINSFDWEKYEQSTSVLDYPEMSAERIMCLRDKMTKSFYYRPKIIWRTLRKVHNFNEFRNFTRMIRGFLDWI